MGAVWWNLSDFGAVLGYFRFDLGPVHTSSTLRGAWPGFRILRWFELFFGALKLFFWGVKAVFGGV